jgi:hypothetical protein
MSPQIMDQFQQFLKFQQIQTSMNQLPPVPVEIKTFREFTDTNEESVKTEVVIKQIRPQNLAQQRQSLMKILSKKK